MQNTTTSVHPTDDSVLRPSEVGILIYGLFCFFGYVLSLISLFIHFYKFFVCKGTQSLATKNLTSYCVCLFISYLYYPIGMSSLVKELPTGDFFMQCFTRFTLAFLLLTMSIDICLCFRKTARKFRLSSNPREKMFILYSIINWNASWVVALIIYFVFGMKHANDVARGVIMSVRVCCLVPFFMSLWYISVAMFDKSILWSNFSLHVRLLIMTGVVSVVQDTTLAIMLIAGGESDVRGGVVARINDCFFLYEGFIVGVFFTFKKNTFKAKKVVYRESTTTETLKLEIGV